jgi:site-specific recombinase XerD
MLKDMANRYNFFYFEAEFKKYLTAGKAESSTIKNYLSDLHYFFSWIQNNQGIEGVDMALMADVFSHSLISEYHQHLASTSQAENTTVRRLATLRKFFSFCVEQRWLTSNPALDYSSKSKKDERYELIAAYKKSLIPKQYSTDELERHISVIKDLVINY